MNAPDYYRSGFESIVDAYGCSPARLGSRAHLETIVAHLVADLDLHPIGEPQWHEFGGGGGLTAVIMLAESHITLHTFPERGFAAFNLYHCRPKPAWPWEQRLTDLLGATRVSLRTIIRGDGAERTRDD